jgi:ATP-dependent Lon protease
MSGHPPLPSTLVDLPLLPLARRGGFPHMVIPLFVGRPKSIKALEAAMEAERRIMLVAQKAAAKDEPSTKDMFEMGCVATILQMLKLPDGTVKVLVEGLQRAKVLDIRESDTHFVASVTPSDPAAERAHRRPTSWRRCAVRSCSSSTSTSSSTRRSRPRS